MSANLSNVATLCRESLALADEIERNGGPVNVSVEEFNEARGRLEGILGDIDGRQLGFLPLVAVWWALAAAGVITAAVVLPTAIRGTQNVVETVTASTSSLVQTTEKAITFATYGALALGAYWAAKLVFRKTKAA